MRVTVYELSKVALASCVALGAVSCADEGCDVALEDCDSDQCVVVSGQPVNGDGTRGSSREAGCAEKVEITSPAETMARSEDGACWVFATTLVPARFVVDPSCAQEDGTSQ